MNTEKSKPQLLDVVDSHFHVFAAQTAQTALTGARYIPAYEATLSAWQTAARASGVGRGVLVQTSFMGTDNGHLLTALAAFPQTLRGVAVVAPGASLASLQSLHEQGVRGIRLNLAGGSHDLSAWARATALWDALLQLGWHLQLHTDRGALPPVLAALPEALALVIDHFGRPASDAADDETLRAVVRRSRLGGRQVHIKLSAAYRLGGLSPQTLARRWQGELGSQALLWGSDWPCTNHEASADYEALFNALASWLSDNTTALAAVRSTNPLRLYWGTGGNEAEPKGDLGSDREG